jgi:hypothetical protein
LIITRSRNHLHLNVSRRLFAKEGYAIALVARNQDSLNKLKSELNETPDAEVSVNLLLSVLGLLFFVVS